MLELAIIIVNFRTAGLTIDSISALLADDTLPPSTHIHLVDGASGDGSAEQLAAAIAENGWAGRVTLLPLGVNGGFAYGNNRGIEAAHAQHGAVRYFLLLNPDTVPRRGACKVLVDFLDQHERVGIVGSSLEDPDGTQQACSFRFPSILSELEGEARTGVITKMVGNARIVLPVENHPTRADWVSGASMMVRGAVLDQIGPLDEKYFLYFEELDFCRRAVEQGWEIWTVPESRVVHLCGQSTGLSDRKAPPRRKPSYWFHSRNRYFGKHHSGVYNLGVDTAWLVGQGIWKLRRGLERKDNFDPPRLVRDFVAHIGKRGD